MLACEDCWKEVEVDRRGRQLAELARESAPDDLRQRIGAALVAPPRRRFAAGLVGALRRRSRLSTLVITATAACVVALAAVVVAVAMRGGTPAPVSAAIAEFRAQRLPGPGTPATAAPDLTRIGYTQTAAGAGDLAGVPVSAYAYRDGSGHRLLVYIGQRPFATPREVERYEGSDAWITEEHGVAVLCGRHPHVTLVVGHDEQQVMHAGEFLDLT
jgi:hypothetical protein